MHGDRQLPYIFCGIYPEPCFHSENHVIELDIKDYDFLHIQALYKRKTSPQRIRGALSHFHD